MNTVVIIHFQPLELYPPIQNLIRELEVRKLPLRIMVITTATRLNLKNFQSEAIEIVRIGSSSHRWNVFSRYLNYLLFYILCSVRLIARRPAAIVYYESLSSFPAWLYKTFVRKSVDLYIHYHEYTTPEAYANGMLLERIFHKLELKLYSSASWVSHTNGFRMDKFKLDILPVRICNPQVMPNYPPKSWLQTTQAHQDKPLKVVYTGSLSLQTMYLKEFVTWVIQQNGNVQFDIYSHNNSSQIVQYLEAVRSPWVILHAGVDYEQLPLILSQHHVGVILYKGHIPNFVYNAPNKLFEYYACGLDVWFPDSMVGSLPYATKDVYPMIMPVDFTQLKFITLEQLSRQRHWVYHKKEFYSEEAYLNIIKMLSKYAV